MNAWATPSRTLAAPPLALRVQGAVPRWNMGSSLPVRAQRCKETW